MMQSALMTRTEKALEVAVKIAQTREALRLLEAEFARFVGDDPAQDMAVKARSTEQAASSIASVLFRPLSGKSLPDRIIELLEAAPEEKLSAQQIIDALGEGHRGQTVRTSLSRLLKSKRIQRGRPGEYQASKEKSKD